MPICFECHSYIDGLIPAQIYSGLMCPVCRTVIVDDLTTLAEWLDSQDEEI
jgi:hypothetical protein